MPATQAARRLLILCAQFIIGLWGRAGNIGIHASQECEVLMGSEQYGPGPHILNLSHCDTFFVGKGASLEVERMVPPRSLIVAENANFMLGDSLILSGSLHAKDGSKVEFGSDVSVLGGDFLVEKEATLTVNGKLHLSGGHLGVATRAALKVHGELDVSVSNVYVAGTLYCHQCGMHVAKDLIIHETGSLEQAEPLIMKSDSNGAMVEAVAYYGSPTILTWDIQYKVCKGVGTKVPDLSQVASMKRFCSYSSEDKHEVTDSCNETSQNFTHVSGALSRNSYAYMCAPDTCQLGFRIHQSTHNHIAQTALTSWTTVKNGDYVFCELPQLGELRQLALQATVCNTMIVNGRLVSPGSIELQARRFGGNGKFEAADTQKLVMVNIDGCIQSRQSSTKAQLQEAMEKVETVEKNLQSTLTSNDTQLKETMEIVEKMEQQLRSSIVSNAEYEATLKTMKENHMEQFEDSASLIQELQSELTKTRSNLNESIAECQRPKDIISGLKALEQELGRSLGHVHSSLSNMDHRMQRPELWFLLCIVTFFLGVASRFLMPLANRSGARRTQSPRTPPVSPANWRSSATRSCVNMSQSQQSRSAPGRSLSPPMSFTRSAPGRSLSSPICPLKIAKTTEVLRRGATRFHMLSKILTAPCRSQSPRRAQVAQSMGSQSPLYLRSGRSA
jgi:hypothetical protein